MRYFKFGKNRLFFIANIEKSVKICSIGNKQVLILISKKIELSYI